MDTQFDIRHEWHQIKNGTVRYYVGYRNKIFTRSRYSTYEYLKSVLANFVSLPVSMSISRFIQNEQPRQIYNIGFDRRLLWIWTAIESQYCVQSDRMYLQYNMFPPSPLYSSSLGPAKLLWRDVFKCRHLLLLHRLCTVFYRLCT